MEAFLVSAGLVAVAEIGDKTQLLAMVLASRYRRPVPIILGILVATLANHALAAAVGAQVAAWVGPHTMRWTLAVLFLAMAAWCLVPDKADEGPKTVGHAGAFLATAVAFFLVEMGDKTQIATVGLAARFQDVVTVTAGTTVGMLLANVPAVLCGDVLARKVPLRLVRMAAAASFAILAVLTVIGLEMGLFSGSG
ncbi:TMEM165/GDT1 family protein [Enhydrobacter sp.]|jgi:putative Ca2+/H+ antiporter (TMEM165/GDT1 family)|uniref:TMEM165/GDT1 family protein n=1 Tax=Enhydrobacter sp. TaxID=1894999 RepID=UPI00262CF124|nr:TMEM165/GDT1 family protein [Enhydrobacter sp.]WIM11594.1 MAG: Putative transmembrane protein [Enhydrobacter sp.]